MGNLHVTKFRVLNYRNIDDSEWIPVEQVTSFVGRNESGKTALLKALHKFNPAMPEPYKAQREFPRDRFSAQYDDGAHWAVCEVDFTLSQDLRERLSQGWDKAEPPVSVVCTRYYDGSLSFRCEPKIGDSSIPADSLREALGEFAKGARRLATEDPEQEEKTQAIRTGLANWATNWNDTVKGLTDLRSDSGVQTLQKIKTEVETKSQPLTADLVDAIQAVIGKLLEETTSPTRKEILDKIIKESLPVFIYFENYGILDSAVYLPRLLEDLEKTPHDAKVRTVNALFKHVGLTAQEIADLGRSEASEARLKDENVTQKMIQRDQERKELRAVKLNSASIDITQRFAKWWQQRRHKIRYDVDGDYFRVWVSDDRRPDVEIELEERSKGFQWFFSFYLVFLVESAEGHKDAILLLDEPGLHLHPTAQQELIGFFETLSERNQLIYSTHSPFLIDGEHLHRVRPVTEDETGHSSVSVESWPDDRDTIFPLQAAAGYAMMKGLFRHRKNVLVEGLSDYYYIHALSLQCRAAGRGALSDEVYVTPCGGAKQVSQMSSLFLGEKVRPVVLLDADDEGRNRKNALIQHLYSDEQRGVILLSEVLGKENCEIEDIIGAQTLMPVVNEIVDFKLTLADEDKEKSLPDRIKGAAAAAGVELPWWWKGEAARRLAIKCSEIPSGGFPSSILDRAEKLFQEIEQRFAVIKQPLH